MIKTAKNGAQPLPSHQLLFIHISGLGESDDFEVLIESV